VARWLVLRFHSPLIEPDGQFSERLWGLTQAPWCLTPQDSWRCGLAAGNEWDSAGLPSLARHNDSSAIHYRDQELRLEQVMDRAGGRTGPYLSRLGLWYGRMAGRYNAMKRKYERAANRQWLTVEPDSLPPSEPELPGRLIESQPARNHCGTV
jgi:hypothetical protein